MKPITPPIIFVRRVKIQDGDYFEYYIRQGDQEVNFFLDREQHEALQSAQLEANREEIRKPESPFSLRVVGRA